jgi:hypothetical protein
MTVIAKIFAPLHEVRLQRHFIILAITAYLLQTAAYAVLYSRAGLSMWHLSQYSLWVADIILLPIVLFLIMWFAARRAATRTERLFKAFAWTTVGLALQTLLSLVYRVWLQRYLPYDGTHWYESWSILHPSVVAIVVVIGVILAARYEKRISLAAYRVAASLVVLGAYAYSGVFMFRDTLRHYVALPNAFYFGIGALALGIILFTNYLLTTKEQDSYSERLYASTVYVMIGGFIFTILGGVWTIAGQLGPTWVHASVVNDILVLTALLLYSGVLFWHKRQLVI